MSRPPRPLPLTLPLAALAVAVPEAAVSAVPDAALWVGVAALGVGGLFGFGRRESEATPSEPDGSSEHAAPPEPPPSTTGGRSLLAGELTRAQTAELFADAGYTTDVVPDGEAAVRAVMNAPYDIVCMDVSMPRMSGVEALKALRGVLPEEQRPRIVAVTSEAGECEQMVAAGFDACLAVPVQSDGFIAALQPTPTGAFVDAPTPTAEPTYVVRAHAPDDRQLAEAEAAEALLQSVRAHVADLIGEEDPEFVADLVGTFHATASETLERARQAATAGDIEAVSRVAHALKGSAVNIGLHDLGNVWTTIENGARQGDDTVLGTPLYDALAETERAVRLITTAA